MSCGMVANDIGTLHLQDRPQFFVADIDLVETCTGVNILTRSMSQIINDQHMMACIEIGSG